MKTCGVSGPGAFSGLIYSYSSLSIPVPLNLGLLLLWVGEGGRLRSMLALKSNVLLTGSSLKTCTFSHLKRQN